MVIVQRYTVVSIEKGQDVNFEDGWEIASAPALIDESGMFVE